MDPTSVRTIKYLPTSSFGEVKWSVLSDTRSETYLPVDVVQFATRYKIHWEDPIDDRYRFYTEFPDDAITDSAVVYHSTELVSWNPACLRDHFRAMLSSRSKTAIITSRTHLKYTSDEREIRARDTLRTFIGEDRWRRFVRDGFITVHSPKDKRTYQIYGGNSYDNMTKVYANGVMVERLCCYLKGNFPPTDHLLMRFLLILNSPDEFSRLCNVHSPTKPRSHPWTTTPNVSLTETLRQLRLEVA